MTTERFVACSSALAGLLTAHTFVNQKLLRRPSIDPPTVLEEVCVCVPARNEAANIDACLASILASTGIPKLQVIVLDDASDDTTAVQVAEIAARNRRVTSVRGGPELPGGWIGKTNAAQQLFERSTGTYIVFVDADVRLEPDAIRASIGLLNTADLDLVSPYPRQIAITAAERLVQPLLQWLWLTFLPLRLAEQRQPVTMVAANGQFMVARREALSAVDGFRRVAGEVLDDVALGRTLKRAGFRVAVVDGTQLASCRMYDSWPALRDGYTKNLWSATGSPMGAVALGAMLTAAYVVPPVAGVLGSIAGRRRLATYGGLGTVAGAIGRLISARTTGARVADSLAHPISIVTLVMLIARSWRHHNRGLIVWKGRTL